MASGPPHILHPEISSLSRRPSLPVSATATAGLTGSMAGPPLPMSTSRSSSASGPPPASQAAAPPPQQRQQQLQPPAMSISSMTGGQGTGLPILSSALAADALAMKLTRGHSCVLCQQRKVRCDKNKPCANCVKAQVECRVVPPQPPRRRKKKPHERELVERLRKYESLLSQHGVRFDPMSASAVAAAAAAAATARGASLDEVDELQNELVGLKTSPGSSGYKDYRAQDDGGLRDSSDDDVEGSTTIHHAFDSMFDNQHQDGFPFVVGGTACRVTDSHPAGMQIFQLWQIYLTNVNPLLKVTHTPTLQAQIIEAGANVGRIPRALEALMFSIYFVAVTSMSDEDVQATFSEDRTRLLARFHRASQQALINAGFMRSPDLAVLQAYFLYLLCVRQYVDPRSLFCLIGIAVRIAQRLGLHRDGTHFRLPPFEAEMRRRLWWQIVALDKRIAEITGSVVTALSAGVTDTRFPLNINDSDLHQHAKEAPMSNAGPTEMLFCLTRVEMCMAGGGGGSSSRTGPGVTPNASVTSPGSSGTPGSASASASTATTATRKFHFSPNPNSPDVVTHMANQTLPSDPDSFCSYMESTYLKACDPEIPLQFFTLMMTRQALCKMRIVQFLNRTGVPGGGPGGMGSMGAMMGGPMGSMGPPGPSGPPAGPAVDDTERDALFVEAIHMVEYDNVMQSADSLRGFSWYTCMHFPFPAYMFIVMELRTRLRSGDLAERAWAAICENHDRRGLVRNPRSPVHVTFGGLFIKAWDAHETAELQQGRRAPPVPTFIRLLQQLVPKTTGPESHQQQQQQQPLPSMGGSSNSAGSMGDDEVVMAETSSSLQSQQQQQLHQRHQQQHQQEQQQQQQQTQQTQHRQLHQQQGPTPMFPGTTSQPGPPGLASSNVFDGLMPGMGTNMPEMMDLGNLDWNMFMQGDYGSYNAGFTPMYG
ncbi:c6 zinc finger domain containing protein [Grosmannia clavigera kw1407]|uniref:C6 zinc finger domain containing protein n=1 Tax=Grosmannia clavigera (strain kw1407 / UAMH 11150) TaxID=655863 RepID=F0XFK6_GROCL|nr:c6 zinc finger domain containing protein [Grosmannia clavigera kw1407]EFX03967.1 c6 zinc finger domain containing protein [Grosmannia clavigera kw1407]